MVCWLAVPSMIVQVLHLQQAEKHLEVAYVLHRASLYLDAMSINLSKNIIPHSLHFTTYLSIRQLELLSHFR